MTAEFFAVLYGDMLVSGDTTLWDALSGPDCDFCAHGSDQVAKYRDAKSEVSGGAVNVDQSKTRGSVHDDGLTYVGVVLSQAPIVVATPGGSSKTYDGGTYGVIYQMAFVDGAWQILGGEVVKPEEVL